MRLDLERVNDDLGDVRRQKAELDALHHELARTLRSLVEAGSIELTRRHGRLVLAMQSEVLFDPGQTEIKPAGQAALAEVAAALRTMRRRRFQVSGHTDASPIHNSRFPSNWELSSARAIEVVRLLIAQGVAPGVLSGTGYAEFEPVASNGHAAGRARNRRIEISLEPDLSAIAAMPQLRAVTPAVAKSL